jgi:glutaredoxin
MAHPTVKLYALSTCGHCRSTKSLLNELQVEYDCVEVDLCSGEERQAVIDEVRDLNPNLSFPTIVIGDTVIVGYKEAEIKKALGL